MLEALTRDPLSMAPKEAPEALGQLAAAIQQGLRAEWRPTQLPVIRSLLATCSRTWSFGNAGMPFVSPYYELFQPFTLLFSHVCCSFHCIMYSRTDSIALISCPHGKSQVDWDAVLPGFPLTSTWKQLWKDAVFPQPPMRRFLPVCI